MKKRNQYSAEFKCKVVLEVLQEASTISEIGAKYGISPVVIGRWKNEFLERAPGVFKKGPSAAEKELIEKENMVAQLERKVGQLTYEVDWLKKNLRKSSDPAGRKSLVDTDFPITIKRQAELLGINRTSFYRQARPKTISAEDLHIMRRIDELHTAYPTWGYRTITRILRRDDHLKINRKKVRRMMRAMGIYTIFPKPNLSKRYHAQYVQPYLLRNLDINRADQVWGVDITYVPIKNGFMYLFVIIDWYSRCIVDFELSSTLEKSFVMTCLKRAFRTRRPEIMNSDQGSHFTNPDYLSLLEANGIKISIDGKGQALDNVRTERVFRTIKYGCVYINEFNSPRELRIALNDYIHTYNTYRPHSSINGFCPAEVYNGSMAA